MNDYQEKCRSTRKNSANTDYCILGLGGEAGEIQSKVAKAMRDGYKVDREDMAKELGDVLWFVAMIALDFGYSLQEIADMNLSKLQDRKERGVIEGSGDNR